MVNFKEQEDEKAAVQDTTTAISEPEEKQENYTPKMKPGDVEIPNRVFVKGFPKDTLTDELSTRFEQFGKVIDCRIVADRYGNSKGFGFVTFDSQNVAQEVIERERVKFQDDLEVVIGPARIRKKRFYLLPGPGGWSVPQACYFQDGNMIVPASMQPQQMFQAPVHATPMYSNMPVTSVMPYQNQMQQPQAPISITQQPQPYNQQQPQPPQQHQQPQQSQQQQQPQITQQQQQQPPQQPQPQQPQQPQQQPQQQQPQQQPQQTQQTHNPLNQQSQQTYGTPVYFSIVNDPMNVQQGAYHYAYPYTTTCPITPMMEKMTIIPPPADELDERRPRSYSTPAPSDIYILNSI